MKNEGKFKSGGNATGQQSYSDQSDIEINTSPNGARPTHKKPPDQFTPSEDDHDFDNDDSNESNLSLHIKNDNIATSTNYHHQNNHNQSNHYTQQPQLKNKNDNDDINDDINEEFEQFEKCDFNQNQNIKNCAKGMEFVNQDDDVDEDEDEDGELNDGQKERCESKKTNYQHNTIRTIKQKIRRGTNLVNKNEFHENYSHKPPNITQQKGNQVKSNHVSNSIKVKGIKEHEEEIDQDNIRLPNYIENQNQIQQCSQQLKEPKNNIDSNQQDNQYDQANNNLNDELNLKISTPDQLITEQNNKTKKRSKNSKKLNNDESQIMKTKTSKTSKTSKPKIENNKLNDNYETKPKSKSEKSKSKSGPKPSTKSKKHKIDIINEINNVENNQQENMQNEQNNEDKDVKQINMSNLLNEEYFDDKILNDQISDIEVENPVNYIDAHENQSHKNDELLNKNKYHLDLNLDKRKRLEFENEINQNISKQLLNSIHRNQDEPLDEFKNKSSKNKKPIQRAKNNNLKSKNYKNNSISKEDNSEPLQMNFTKINQEKVKNPKNFKKFHNTSNTGNLNNYQNHQSNSSDCDQNDQEDMNFSDQSDIPSHIENNPNHQTSNTNKHNNPYPNDMTLLPHNLNSLIPSSKMDYKLNEQAEDDINANYEQSNDELNITQDFNDFDNEDMDDDMSYENQLLQGDTATRLGHNTLGHYAGTPYTTVQPKQFGTGITLKQTRLHRETNDSPRRNGMNMFEMADGNNDDIEVVYDSKKGKKDNKKGKEHSINLMLNNLNHNKSKFNKSTNNDYDTKNVENIGQNTDVMCNEFIFKAQKFPNQVKINFNSKTSHVLKDIREQKRKIKTICKEIKKTHYANTLRLSHQLASGNKYMCNTFKMEGIANKLEFIKYTDNQHFDELADNDISHHFKKDSAKGWVVFKKFWWIEDQNWVNLFKHQKEAIFFMLENFENNRNVILADDMGLGKTITTLTFLLGLMNSGVVCRAIIIVPLALIDNWIREIINWCPKTLNQLQLHAGNNPRLRRSIQDNMDKMRDKYILITTLSLMRNDTYISTGEYQFVLIDEAHFIRNVKSSSFGAISNLKGCKFKMCISGTPIQNSYRDLCALLNFLDIDELGDNKQFMSNFIQPIERGLLSDASDLSKSAATKKITELRNVMTKQMIRREKVEIMKLNNSPLPPKADIIIWIKLTKLQESIYNSLLDIYDQDRCNSQVVFHLMAMIFGLLDHPFMVQFAVKNALKGATDYFHNEIDKNCYQWFKKGGSVPGGDGGHCGDVKGDNTFNKGGLRNNKKGGNTTGTNIARGDLSKDEVMMKANKQNKKKNLIDKCIALGERERHPENFAFKNNKALTEANAVNEQNRTKRAKQDNECDKNGKPKKEGEKKGNSGNTQLNFILNNKVQFEKFYKNMSDRFTDLSLENVFTLSNKMLVLKELLANIMKDKSNKIIIFFNSKSAMDIVECYLMLNQQKDNFLSFDGSTPKHRRYKIIDMFQNELQFNILMMNVKTGGVGLNITSANYVIMFNNNQNPMLDSQAIDRAQRIGQKRQVTVFRLFQAQTLDQNLYKLQLHKSTIVRTSDVSVDGTDITRQVKKSDFSQIYNLDTEDKFFEKLIKHDGFECMQDMVDFNQKLVNNFILVKLKGKCILDLSDNGGIHKNNSFKNQFMRMQMESKQDTKKGQNTNLDVNQNPKDKCEAINLEDDEGAIPDGRERNLGYTVKDAKDHHKTNLTNQGSFNQEKDVIVKLENRIVSFSQYKDKYKIENSNIGNYWNKCNTKINVIVKKQINQMIFQQLKESLIKLTNNKDAFLRRQQFDSSKLITDVFGNELQEQVKNGIDHNIKQSFSQWMKNLFIVKRLKNSEDFYKLENSDQQRLLSGNEIKGKEDYTDKKTVQQKDNKFHKTIDSKLTKEKPVVVQSQQSQMEDVPSNDESKNKNTCNTKPANITPVHAVQITEDDMQDDDSDKIMVAKKIPLVKQRKESIEQHQRQDTINIKLLEAKIININSEHNDLRNMNFDEAYNHLDNKLSNLIDNDNKESNANKNILDDDEESGDELKQDQNAEVQDDINMDDKKEHDNEQYSEQSFQQFLKKFNINMDAKEVLKDKKKDKDKANPLANPLKMALDPYTNETKKKGRPKILNNTTVKDIKFPKGYGKDNDKIKDICKSNEVIKILDKEPKQPNLDISKLKFKEHNSKDKEHNNKQIVDIGNINITSKNEKIQVDEDSDRETQNLLDSAEDPEDIKSVWSDEQNPHDGLGILNKEDVPYDQDFNDIMNQNLHNHNQDTQTETNNVFKNIEMLKERNKMCVGEDLMSNQSQKLPKNIPCNNTDLDQVLNKKQIPNDLSKQEAMNKQVKEKSYYGTKSSEGHERKSEQIDKHEGKKGGVVKAFSASLDKPISNVRKLDEHEKDHVINRQAKHKLKNQLGKRIETIREQPPEFINNNDHLNEDKIDIHKCNDKSNGKNKNNVVDICNI